MEHRRCAVAEVSGECGAHQRRVGDAFEDRPVRSVPDRGRAGFAERTARHADGDAADEGAAHFGVTLRRAGRLRSVHVERRLDDSVGKRRMIEANSERAGAYHFELFGQKAHAAQLNLPPFADDIRLDRERRDRDRAQTGRSSIGRLASTAAQRCSRLPRLPGRQAQRHAESSCSRARRRTGSSERAHDRVWR